MSIPSSPVPRDAVPLSLGRPGPKELRPLLAGLLHQRCCTVDEVRARHRSPFCGPPVVPASALPADAAGRALGPVVVGLDVDPDSIVAPAAAIVPHHVVRFTVDILVERDGPGALSDAVGPGALSDAVGLRLPAPLVIFATPGDATTLAELAATISECGHPVGLPAGSSNEAVADFLAVLAHSSVGFVSRARDTSEVLAILAGTVAALRGDDIRSALASPRATYIGRLNPEAASAVREVLLGIEVPDPRSIEAEMISLGLN